MQPIRSGMMALSFAVALTVTSAPGAELAVSTLVQPGKDGRLVYRPYSERGDTIPELSNCGFGGGGVPIPVVGVAVVLSPLAGSGDDRQRIQAALDQVARRPVDAQGWRGAVLLKRGTYRVADTLKIETSGVVLRVEGVDERGTLLLATGRSVGGLYDNVVAPIAIQDRQYLGSGHGWAGANYVVWNCAGSLVCQQPPTAQNFAIGFVGTKQAGSFPRPEGWWESLGRHVTPRSLYRAQLAGRLRAPAR